MHRLIYAIVLALAILTTPLWEVVAQAPTEHVILDTSIYFGQASGLNVCMSLGAGQVTMTTRIERPSGANVPLTMALTGLRDPGLPLVIQMSEVETSVNRKIAGGVYCWSISADVPPSNSADPVIAVTRITHTPE